MNSLFEASARKPLADRLRPDVIGDVLGQDHLLGPGAPLSKMLASGHLGSLLLWGPPGTGKTTLARILAKTAGMAFDTLSAVLSGIAELRKALDAAVERRKGTGRNTVLFVDEIHRWNKSQQDALLPFVEDGTITLIGATTENPSFEINSALLSRVEVFVLRPLGHDALKSLLRRAEMDIGGSLPLDDEARGELIRMADGDGRYLLNLVERLSDLDASRTIRAEDLAGLVQRRFSAGGRNSDTHHALFSALQKSVRGSDANASLYWMARCLRAGEPPKGLFRRLAVMATEEIGLADPNAIQQVAACAAAFERVGDPEGLPALAQCVAYLATAPKSNAVYEAFFAAMALAESSGSVPPPRHLVNAPTRLMRHQGFKDGYKYDHDFPQAFSGQEFFPEGLDGDSRPEIYRPTERGNERDIGRRVDWWDRKRTERR